MQHHIQTLVKHFFRKESLQEVTLNQLQQFIDDYPYSAVGQLLLAKKLRETGAQNFEEQGSKTTLYFHDPAWAAWLLREEQASANDFAPINSFVEIAREPEAVTTRPGFNLNYTASEPVTPEAETPPWEVNEPADAAPREEMPAIDANLDLPPVEEPVVANEQPVVEQPSMPHERPAEEPPTAAPEGHLLKDIPAQNDDINFEPYHTIDYFASLGIKLKPEDLAKDKLGQQLKSFTDWLRSMKKITPTPGAENSAELDELTNKSIQRIAEFSNDAKEIITEAMAEVWAKQGHREKAVAIYEKLSLLNPAKSHYFATRINELKA